MLLSTCNRIELYTASEEDDATPSHQDVVQFFAEFHGLQPIEVFDDLFERSGEDAGGICSRSPHLDSMVLGEAQILAASEAGLRIGDAAIVGGPLTNQAFQAALKVAKRVATKPRSTKSGSASRAWPSATSRRTSLSSFEDKRILLIGAGEMGEETLTYLKAEGARDIVVVNRSYDRAVALAEMFGGRAEQWEFLPQLLVDADLVITTTGATEPIVTLADFQRIEAERFLRDLFILDLAVPRDFDPAIGDCNGVYLYSIDDLQEACRRNRAERDRELPAGARIVEAETARFMADLHHRATAPIIKRLKQGWQTPKEDELRRLFNKLPELYDKARAEIAASFERLINKLLHPPLESLRDEARHGVPHGLLDALKRLFRIKE